MSFFSRGKTRTMLFKGLIVLLLAPGFLGSAQNPHIRFTSFTQKQGLSHYYVSAFAEDRHGFIWIGTSDGLNRFDGHRFSPYFLEGEGSQNRTHYHVECLGLDRDKNLWIGTGSGLHRFLEAEDKIQKSKPHAGDKDGILDHMIHCIFTDSSGVMWVGSSRGVVRLIDGRVDRIWSSSFEKPGAIRGRVNDVCEDPKGNLWLATTYGLYRFDPNRENFVFQATNPEHRLDRLVNNISKMTLDASGNLWLATHFGVRYFDTATGNVTVYHQENSAEFGLDAGQTADVLVDRNQRVWVSTNFEGLFMKEPDEPRFKRYLAKDWDREGLPSNQMRDLFQSSNDLIWVGNMTKGFSFFQPKDLAFAEYRHEPDNPQSLPSGSVWAFYAPDAKNIWIGSDYGLSHWDRLNQSYQHFSMVPEEPEDVPKNRVRKIIAAGGNKLWLGGRGSLMGFDMKTHEVTHMPLVERDQDRVRDLLVDSEGILWIATYGEGVFARHPERGVILRLTTRSAGMTLFSNETRCLYLDEREALWIGTQKGLHRVNAGRNKISLFLNPERLPPNSRKGSVLAITPDKENGGLWLATGGGIIYFNLEHAEERLITTDEGMPSNLVYGIKLHGDDLWATTERGLVRYDRASGDLRVFTTYDGLGSNDFNSGGIAQLPDSSLILAGTAGINLFHPERIPPPNPAARVVLTSFRLNAREVALASKEAPTPLAAPIHLMDVVDLSHNQTVFSFDFSLLSFVGTEQNTYQYQLAGFDEDWIEVGADRRSATYTNLDGKTYHFRVKATDRNGIHSANTSDLTIRVARPPWRSWPAYAAYLFLLLSMAGYYLHTQRTKIAQERRVIERLRQVDKLRDDFLANTSHELRTPLNGIIGLAESLHDGATGPLPQATLDSLNLITSIGRRLSALVNDILDFAQVRNSELVLHKKEVNLHAVVDEVITLTQATLGDKPIVLVNEIGEEQPLVPADEDRLMQILHNLVGNAVKFTAAGQVRVGADWTPDQVVVHVSDTGIGISPEKLDLIFETFRQGDEDISREYGGTGLGLAITRELVHRHQGQLAVKSVMDKGSTFSFSLPRVATKKDLEPAKELQSDLVSRVEETPGPATGPLVETSPHIQLATDHFRILVVDDEPINCKVLENHLEAYQVVSVHSGEGCLSLLEEERFDLVLLDIMMPRLSGYEVCRRIREKFTQFQLPVIFLSARNRVIDLTVGFDSGANDYITKPISKSELIRRVRTHLSLLDTHRVLEERISERTAELAQKNQDLLKTQNKLIMQEKTAFLGTLASGIAHEIRNPLNFVHGLALVSTEQFDDLEELLVKVKTDCEQGDALGEIVTDLKRNLHVILKHGRRANGIVENLMTLSREGFDSLSEADVGALLENSAKLVYRNMLGKRDFFPLEINTEFDPGVPKIMVFTKDLNRVFANIILNAVEAMLSKNQTEGFQPRLNLWTRLEGPQVLIGIRDNGHGIPPEYKERIFDPFFTLKPPDSHHIGLGLSICFDIITQEHDGEIRLESVEDEYTEFVIALPVVQGKNE